MTTMRKLLAATLWLMTLWPLGASAQTSFTALDAGGVSRTFSSFSCSTIICPLAVPADASGNALPFAGQNATSPTSAQLAGGQFNTTPTTLSSGNASPLQLDSAADLLVNLKTALPAGSNVIGAVTQSGGPWTENLTQIGGSSVSTAATGVQKVGIVGNAGAVFDFVGQNATQPANSILTGCEFNTTPTTITNGNASPCQVDNAGNALVDLKTALPAGSNNIGAVTQASGPWSNNVTQFGGTNISTGTGAGGAGIPRVTISNDSSLAANQSVNLNQVAGGAASNAGQTGALQVGGSTAAGNNISSATNPLVIAGSDYGGTPKVQALKVDSSGNAQVAVTNTPTVTANAGTNLNTSALALESGGNLATVAGAVSAGVMQENVKQVNGVATLAGAGAVGTGSQRVAVGQDTSTVAGSAPGTAGSASANVLSVQGVASMTPVQVSQATASNLNATVVGTGTFATQATDNVTQFGGTNISTGTGASGAGIPRVTISNDSSLAANQSVNITEINGSAPTIKPSGTSPATTDPALVVTQSPNPNPQCTKVININQTATTDVHTFTNVGYICSIILVSATAQNIGVDEGTGTTCETSGTALIGVSSTASATPTMAVGVNGGFSAIGAAPWLELQASADHLCILQSGTGNVSGSITYADHT
jgi:trimeric autotransporter adhesin